MFKKFKKVVPFVLAISMMSSSLIAFAHDRDVLHQVEDNSVISNIIIEENEANVGGYLSEKEIKKLKNQIDKENKDNLKLYEKGLVEYQGSDITPQHWSAWFHTHNITNLSEATTVQDEELVGSVVNESQWYTDLSYSETHTFHHDYSVGISFDVSVVEAEVGIDMGWSTEKTLSVVAKDVAPGGSANIYLRTNYNKQTFTATTDWVWPLTDDVSTGWTKKYKTSTFVVR